VFGLDLECLELCRVNKEYDTSTFIWLLLFVQLVFSDTNHWYFFFDELSSHTRSLFVYWHPDFTVCLGQGVFWKVLHEGDVQSRGLSRDPNAFLFLQGVLPTGQCSLPSPCLLSCLKKILSVLRSQSLFLGLDVHVFPILRQKGQGS
jgi:hypothetical protein